MSPLFVEFSKTRNHLPPPHLILGGTMPPAELVGLEALQTSGKMTRYFLKQELNFLLK